MTCKLVSQMASISTNTLSIETVNTIIDKLSPDEKAKGFLLSRLPEQFTFDGRKNVRRDKMFWVEVVFINQRYDLLKLLEMPEDIALEKLNACTSFPIIRRLLVKLYDALPISKERDFCIRMGIAVPQSDGSDFQSLAQTMVNLEKCYAANKGGFFQKLRDVLKSMEVTGVDEELVQYFIPNETYDQKYYPMDRSPCGKCLIINNKTVKDELDRVGSEIDVALLKNTFENFDFIVECHHDLNHETMLAVLKNAALQDHTNFSAFVCCIMSHGDNGVVYSTDGHDMKIHDIRMIFCQCKTLIGKPKIFFYQACRGRNLERVYMTDGSTPDVKVEDSQKDCLTGLATVEGNVAFRSTQTGSCFIQSLVKGLNSTKTLRKAELWVNKDMENFKITRGMEQVGQTSEWISSLTRDLKFRRNTVFNCN